MTRKRPEKKGVKDKVWVITGTYGLYQGMWFGRNAAIQQHCADLGRDWEYCRKKGDRCVQKILITPLPPRKPGTRGRG